MKPKLTLDHVSYSYHTLEGETLALSDISFSVNNGEFLAIVGPSGCGKSTLLSIMCGLIKPEKGEILVDGEPLAQSENNIGYMLQKDHLFEWRSIFANATLGLEIQNKLNENNKQKIRDMMMTYGLAAFADSKPSALSGGMRQRAALIRTLALEPDLLLLDEPFSALDYQTRLEVCDDISTIIKREQKTAILVTHDLSEAVSVGDRVVILSPRPGRLKSIMPLDFGNEYKTPLQRRNAPEFSFYFNAVWKELKHHG